MHVRNYCRVISQGIMKNQRKRRRIRAFQCYSYYHVLRWRWELGSRENPRSTSVPTIKRPEQPRTRFSLFLRYLWLIHVEDRARAVTFPPRASSSLLYFTLISYSTPLLERTVEVKPKRDKSIDILFAWNDRSLSAREIYYCTNTGISQRTLTADSYRSSLLLRWLSATYP